MKAGAGIASMVSSFAIWMQLEQAAILVLPRHTYPFPPLSTGAPLELGPFLVRVDHLDHAGLRARAWRRPCSSLLYRTRFGLALRAIIGNPVAAHLVGIDVRTAMLLAFAARVGDRRRRRLSGARGRPAGHADVRHVGDAQGPDRHDDRRARLDPGRDPRRIAARRHRGAQPMVFRAADPRPRRLFGAVRLSGAASRRLARRGADARDRDRRRRRDRWTII